MSSQYVEFQQDVNGPVKFAGYMNLTNATHFTSFPAAYGSADTVPIYGRTSTDGLTQGQWNLVDDSVNGDLFHFVTGPNKASNANGAVIAIGVRYGGRGFFANNYGPTGSGSHTIGYELTNLPLNDDSQSYGFLADQFSTAAPLFKFRAQVAGSAVLLWLDSDVGLNAGTVMQKWAANGVAFGEVRGDTGKLDWHKDVAMAANVLMTGLPTADPHVVGQLWNSAGTLKVSAG